LGTPRLLLICVPCSFLFSFPFLPTNKRRDHEVRHDDFPCCHVLLCVGVRPERHQRQDVVAAAAQRRCHGRQADGPADRHSGQHPIDADVVRHGGTCLLCCLRVLSTIALCFSRFPPLPEAVPPLASRQSPHGCSLEVITRLRPPRLAEIAANQSRFRLSDSFARNILYDHCVENGILFEFMPQEKSALLMLTSSCQRQILSI